MKRIKLLLTLIITVILSGIFTVTAFADEPYDVYNYDRWGDAIPSQAGYVAERAVSGDDLGTINFSSPSDIFRDSRNVFYIADSGNNRIIAVDSEFKSVMKIYEKFGYPDGTKTTLSNPQGVFVSDKGLIYIADNENERVLICDKDAKIKMEIKKPDSEIFDSRKTFLPQKVIADKAGNIYVVLGNITTGAAMFSPQGEFLGFYGANRVEPTAKIIENYFLDFFRSEEKKSRRIRSIPSGITGFDIDGDFIYTCTSSTTQKTDTVKKLNAAGDNIFSSYDLTFGDLRPLYDANTNTSYEARICDIDISDDGNINVLDYTTGRVFQYDEDCNLLFILGTTARQLGGFEQVSALESMGKRLYVADSQKNTITIFTETDFGATVHKASKLYNDGYYSEALEPWFEVLKRDGNYRRAYIGIASGYLSKGDYENSMKYAKLADSPTIYNKAFEGWRMEFFDDYLEDIIIGGIIILSAVIVIRKLKKED